MPATRCSARSGFDQSADEQAAAAEDAVGDRLCAEVFGGDGGDPHVVDRGDPLGHIGEPALDRIGQTGLELREGAVP